MIATNSSHVPLLFANVSSNFNNARRLVKKLEQIGVAGACIEDKLFPKTNSLLSDTEGKPLADIEEFCGKIRAMKDTQQDPDFVVVARGTLLAGGRVCSAQPYSVATCTDWRLPR